ncbi:nucleotidyltransferase domain-containing protein [Clostridium sp.]|jgi:predicted nucleotidyltransferase|uniref:nucleotidyltransferase domain-containing protein n=1 Tax=Clostridium sp. TaxID=1506 RepID=UPI0025887A9F|nr:nucleotidyltransferase domain-containing protein [Clostridium sp.]MDF2505477.1 nucleotidyltransferase [Clostridium sp.]
MLNVENKIESLKKYFSEQPNILGVWIIGSYGTEYQREDSDIDFSILYGKYISKRS